MESSINIKEHPALQDASNWTYYNEGNNNIILRYTGQFDPILSEKVLRIRKSTNHEFYTDPCLLQEDEYNSLLIDNVFMKDPILSNRLQETIFVDLSQEFLHEIENKIKERDMSLIRSESTIDFKTPIAMLVTNFSSFHEVTDDPELTNVITFEVKPKSGVTEYVPSVALKYIQDNQE